MRKMVVGIRERNVIKSLKEFTIVANPCPAVMAITDPVRGFELRVDEAQCLDAATQGACISDCIQVFPLESARKFGAKAIG